MKPQRLRAGGGSTHWPLAVLCLFLLLTFCSAQGASSILTEDGNTAILSATSPPEVIDHVGELESGSEKTRGEKWEQVEEITYLQEIAGGDQGPVAPFCPAAESEVSPGELLLAKVANLCVHSGAQQEGDGIQYIAVTEDESLPRQDNQDTSVLKPEHGIARDQETQEATADGHLGAAQGLGANLTRGASQLPGSALATGRECYYVCPADLQAGDRLWLLRTLLYGAEPLSLSEQDSNLLTSRGLVIPEPPLVETLTLSQDAETVERPSRVKSLGLDDYRKAIAEQVLSSANNGSSGATPSPSTVRRKAADGGRYNYAAAVHGAKVVDFNREAKGAARVLDEDKDKYMRNPCSVVDKFIVIELSEPLTRIDTLVLSNYEFYSSSVKEFELFGSYQYPADTWHMLGQFTALNVRTPQSFEVTGDGAGLVRYLKLRLVSHHGAEYMCTLSLVRVHGLDELESLKQEMEVMSKEVEEVEHALRSNSPIPPLAIKNLEAREDYQVQGSSSAEEGDLASLSFAGLDSIAHGDWKIHEVLEMVVDGQDLQRVGRGSETGDASAEGRSTGSLQEGLGTESSNLDLGPGLTNGSPPSITQDIPPAGSVLSSGAPVFGSSASPSITGAGMGSGSSSAGRVGGDFILKTLMYKIRALEVNQSVMERYVEGLHSKYLQTLTEMDHDLASLNLRLKNATAGTSFLQLRLFQAEGKHMQEVLELRRETAAKVQLVLEDVLSVRQQLSRLERRETALLGLALGCLALALLLLCIFFCCSAFSALPLHESASSAACCYNVGGTLFVTGLAFGACILLL